MLLAVEESGVRRGDAAPEAVARNEGGIQQHSRVSRAGLSAAQQTRTMNATVIIKELYTSLAHAKKM